MRNKRQTKQAMPSNPFKHDPIEDDPELKPVLARTAEEAHTELAAQGRSKGFGYCRGFWRVKKQILKQKYQVEWQSPGDMNPEVDFD